MGAAALLLAVLVNPAVLHPRLWNASTFKSEAIGESVLIATGLGLLNSRKWAALVASAIATWLAVHAARDLPPDNRIEVALLLSLPLITTVIGWPALTWIRSKRDLLFVVAAVLISLVTVGGAFYFHQHSSPPVYHPYH